MTSSPALAAPAQASSLVDEDLVHQHLPLVAHVVREALGRVPGHVNRDDLTSAAMMALVQAARAFDTERGMPFAAYATTRMRGAVLDELRGIDWASRSVRRTARSIESHPQPAGRRPRPRPHRPGDRRPPSA